MKHLEEIEDLKLIKQKADEIMPSVYETYRKHGVQGLMETINNFIDKMTAQAEIAKKTTCAKGCHLCCYSEINVSSFEADYIFARVQADREKLNKTRIETQQKKKHYKQKYANKLCAAVGEDGSCQIYEYRPVICRLWNATTRKELCSTKSGKPKTEMIKIAECWALILCLLNLDEMQGQKPGIKLHQVFGRIEFE